MSRLRTLLRRPDTSDADAAFFASIKAEPTDLRYLALKAQLQARAEK